MQGTLEHYRSAFKNIGWFMPPYLTMGAMDKVLANIKEKGEQFTQDDLESLLASIYSPEHLAAMITERYPETPFIKDYKLIIAEATQAHFMGLDHIAVAGLMPVIEGAARKIAADRDVPFGHIRPGFKDLATDCKQDAIVNGKGDVGELVSMLDAFADFTNDNLYVNSEKYPQEDKTNRHGISHGAYSDDDYGKPINFYKTIAAIDFLCLISAFKARISWMSPSITERSIHLATFYLVCRRISYKSPLIENPL